MYKVSLIVFFGLYFITAILVQNAILEMFEGFSALSVILALLFRDQEQ